MVLTGKLPPLRSLVTNDLILLLGKLDSVRFAVAGDLAAEGLHSHFGCVAWTED